MDFNGQKLGGLWRPVAACHPVVLAPKEEVSKLGDSGQKLGGLWRPVTREFWPLKKKFRSLGARIFESSRLEGLLGLLEGGWNNEV